MKTILGHAKGIPLYVFVDLRVSVSARVLLSAFAVQIGCLDFSGDKLEIIRGFLEAGFGPFPPRNQCSGDPYDPD